MNRDELRTREVAIPPQIFHHAQVRSIYPRESSGGTWIACNSHGILLALLNRDAPNRSQFAAKIKSRGSIIPKLIVHDGFLSVAAELDRLCLAEMFPFRLIGIFPATRAVVEWRWDGAQLERHRSPWSRAHWYSSSLSDEAAEIERAKICNALGPVPYPNEIARLRSLHCAHGGLRGPFSVCMHRPDAATVSYTEVICSSERIRLSYRSGNPCGWADLGTSGIQMGRGAQECCLDF